MIKRVVSFALHQPLFVVLMAVLFVGGGECILDTCVLDDGCAS